MATNVSETEARQPDPAAVWSAGGRDYDRVSETIADAIEHCVGRLDPRPGERVLDVATGTGWAARRIAGRGARVTGIDFAPELIEAAKATASAAGLSIDFQVGDAQRLAVPDAGFDAVISTFGVMFVHHPEAAAAELARVCRPGGRLGLLTWPPEGAIAGFFKMVKAYAPAPASPTPSPFEWGKPERLRQLLGGAFTLRFETGTTVIRSPSGQEIWEIFAAGFGPVKSVAARLEPERREQLKRDFIAYHERFRTELGVAMPREYLVTIGVRI